MGCDDDSGYEPANNTIACSSFSVAARSHFNTNFLFLSLPQQRVKSSFWKEVFVVFHFVLFLTNCVPSMQTLKGRKKEKPEQFFSSWFCNLAELASFYSEMRSRAFSHFFFKMRSKVFKRERDSCLSNCFLSLSSLSKLSSGCGRKYATHKKKESLLSIQEPNLRFSFDWISIRFKREEERKKQRWNLHFPSNKPQQGNQTSCGSFQSLSFPIFFFWFGEAIFFSKEDLFEKKFW